MGWEQRWRIINKDIMNNLKELTNILYEMASGNLKDEDDFWHNAYGKLEKEYIPSAKRFGKVTNFSEAFPDVTVEIDNIRNIKKLVERLEFLIKTYDLKIKEIVYDSSDISYHSFGDIKKILEEIDTLKPIKQLQCDRRFLNVVFESKRPIFKVESKTEGVKSLKLKIFIDFFKNEDSTYCTHESAYFR